MDFVELQQFITLQNRRLQKQFPSLSDKEKLTLAYTVKLSEEVGELCNEVLAANGLQRKAKLAKHTKKNLSAECADVLLTTLLVAHAMDVDVSKALEDKIKRLHKRHEKKSFDKSNS